VADGERTAAEREAARLERERRRAGVEDGDGARYAAEMPAAGAAPDGDGHDGGWTDELEELPLGTRRVGHRDRPSGQRPAGQPERGRRAGRPRRTSNRARPRNAVRARPTHSRGHRWLGRGVSVLVLILAVAVIWFLAELFQPFHGSAHGSVTVTIPPHSSSKQIGNLLAKEGVVSSGFFFDLRAMLDGDRSKLLSGTYHLQRGMTYSSALKVLTTPPPAVPTSQLTLIEGLTRAKIGALLSRQHIRGGSYVVATRHSSLLNPRTYGAPARTPTLEGFLFPDTYRLPSPITVPELVKAQLTTFKSQFAHINMSYAKAHHLTAYDVLIIASMVQAEAQTAHDFPLVASVIYNRLRLGMRLQIDATTRYAVGNYTRPLTQSQLNSPSPWNTRVHAGLPPTPIDNPGLAAINAAADPTPSKYLFYITKPCGNGALAFASTDAQFNQLVAAYYAKRATLHGRSPAHC
jgi:UPF0755 protein